MKIGVINNMLPTYVVSLQVSLQQMPNTNKQREWVWKQRCVKNLNGREMLLLLTGRRAILL